MAELPGISAGPGNPGDPGDLDWSLHSSLSDSPLESDLLFSYLPGSSLSEGRGELGGQEIS